MGHEAERAWEATEPRGAAAGEQAGSPRPLPDPDVQGQPALPTPHPSRPSGSAAGGVARRRQPRAGPRTGWSSLGKPGSEFGSHLPHPAQHKHIPRVPAPFQDSRCSHGRAVRSLEALERDRHAFRAQGGGPAPATSTRLSSGSRGPGTLARCRWDVSHSPRARVLTECILLPLPACEAWGGGLSSQGTVTRSLVSPHPRPTTARPGQPGGS